MYFYCDNSTAPNSTNTDCMAGSVTTDLTYPYAFTCLVNATQDNSNHTEFCRVYDGTSYSSTVPNITYASDSTIPTTSIISVAGDTTASYFDTNNDGLTDILVSGEANMLCRWSSSDVVYSSMSNSCTISGTQANCSVNDVASQGFITRYVSCRDLLGNEQNTTQNLNVQFYLDYTAPTTSDNSVSSVKAPNYTITITEADNVDSDPTSYYCTSTSAGCNPTTPIDNGGTITYTASNRGVNYLRYYSVDDAGNTQTAVNKTININQLPVLISASDNAVTIKGGTNVNVSSVSLDSDSGQTLTLFVCSSSGATYSGCTGNEYCSSSGTSNVSCILGAENDSSAHTWYAYLFDSLGEAATANPLTGSYTTDLTAPTITLNNPANASTITQSSVTFTITSNEALTNAWYSLNNGSNISMTNTSLYIYTHSNNSIGDGSYNLSVWANDSYGNIRSLTGNYFIINTLVPDTTAPTITIRSPANGSYSTSASVLLNITTDEHLSWAGYTNTTNNLNNLGNSTGTQWNATITLAEGSHNITFYANDTSNNQANKSILIYVDLTNPQVSSFSCSPNPANDSQNVNCSASVTDAVGLSYVIISHNATGSWQNSSQISLSGTSASLSYIISASNTTMPGFTARIYLYDLSGRGDLTTSYNVNVSDDIYPKIYNITYWPNTTDALDPGVKVNVNATIVEDYKINKVELMWMNLSDGNWISVTMSNNSAIANGSSATVVYNASFLPGNGTYAFKINASDLAGNSNVSSNYTFVVVNETSFWNSTTIPAIKSFTYAQRSDNNTLGMLHLNNTGDNGLDFNLSISASSSILSRFNINYTNKDNTNYSSGVGSNLSLTVLMNTTGLTSGLHPYNLTILSGSETTVYEKQLNIQTAEGAYLQISIDTFSSSVTTSQTGVSYAVSVTNLGTQDASDVVLTWALPSIFTLASGNLTRSFSNIPIGGSGTNTITIDVGSSTSDITYYINATATASNADSANTSKAITVSNPVTITQTITTSGTSGGGGGSGTVGAGKAEVYSKEIEVVRGKQYEFEIAVGNKNSNATLENLVMSLTGFLPQHISISPSLISSINPRESKSFLVRLTAPVYKDYEEYILKASIKGDIVSGSSSSSYSETQNIKLIIQEVSHKDTLNRLEEAEKAIGEMRNKNFSTVQVEKLLIDAKKEIKENNKHEKSFDISEAIIKIKETAFEADDLLRRDIEAIRNPRKSNLIVGNIARNLGSYDTLTPLKDMVAGEVVFASSSIEEIINLGIAAFQRGDYYSALERAKEGRNLLILERKGNFFLFLYLYWHYLLVAVFLVSGIGIFGYRFYQESSITKKIRDIDREENNIRSLILSSQKGYFSGRISVGEYHRTMSQHQNKLAKIKQERLILRNKRIRMLEQEQILQDLRIERLQVENEIRILQGQFYRDKKISESEYNIEFKILNERLAEIEGEKITFELLKRNKDKGIQIKNSKFELGKAIIKSERDAIKQSRIRIIFLKIIGFIKFPLHYFKMIGEHKRLKEEARIKEKIKHMLK